MGLGDGLVNSHCGSAGARRRDGAGDRRLVVEEHRMDVAAGLQSHLPVRVLCVYVRFAGNTDRDRLVANGDGNPVVDVSMQ